MTPSGIEPAIQYPPYKVTLMYMVLFSQELHRNSMRFTSLHLTFRITCAQLSMTVYRRTYLRTFFVHVCQQYFRETQTQGKQQSLPVFNRQSTYFIEHHDSNCLLHKLLRIYSGNVYHFSNMRCVLVQVQTSAHLLPLRNSNICLDR